MISVTKSQKNALWITHSFLRQLRLIQRSRILRASGSRVLRASSSKAVSPIAPHRHARDHAIGESNRADGRYGHLSLLSARSALRFITPISPHPTRACLAVGRSNARDVWRRRGWTASSAPALSARSRRATRIVRPQQQRMVRSRRDRARHWDACSRSTPPPSPASASAPPRSASAGVANGSRASAI